MRLHMRCFYLVGVLHCFIFSVLAQDLPQITKVILPEIKRAGTTGYLNCTITRQGLNKVYWVHRQTQLTISNDDKVVVDNNYHNLIDGYPKYDVKKSVRGDSNTYTLFVRRLVLLDAGQYTCQVTVLGSREPISKDGNLTVLLPPSILKSQTTQVVNAEEHGNATLTCAATGYPTPNITWVRANGRAHPYPINRISYRGNRLTLINLGTSDRGVYRCIADNNVRPPATYDTTLYVDFKPFAKPVQSSYGQAQNRLYDLTIECIISGFPQPDLQWYQIEKKGLKPIKDDEKHAIHVLLNHGQKLSLSQFWYQLTIINVQGNDYGYYVCEGKNRLGIHSSQIYVYETSECQGANCPMGARYVGHIDTGNSAAVASSMATLVLLLATYVITSYC